MHLSEVHNRKFDAGIGFHKPESNLDNIRPSKSTSPTVFRKITPKFLPCATTFNTKLDDLQTKPPTPCKSSCYPSHPVRNNVDTSRTSGFFHCRLSISLQRTRRPLSCEPLSDKDLLANYTILQCFMFDRRTECC